MNATVKLDDLEQTVARCELAVARLRSAVDIENLQAAYGYYVDKCLWDDAANVFAEDASYEYGQQGVYRGRARVREALALLAPAGPSAGHLNNYMMLQPIIDVADDNLTAKARWRSDIQLLSGGRASWGEGVYENEYRNEDGVWKISRLHFYITMLADYDKGWVVGNIPMEGPSRRVPPDAPPTEVYQSLPDVYLPAYHYDHPVTGALPRATHLICMDAEGVKESGSAELRASLQMLPAVARRIERLEDEAAVEKLQRSYGYYVDKGMWPQVADLFCETGTLEIGGRGVFLGRKRVLDYMQGLGGQLPPGPKQGQIINHQQFQGIVTVASDGRSAKGRWTAFVMGGSPYAAIQWGDVMYENEYVKEDGVWKISKLHAPFTMYSLYSDGWHKSTVPNTRPESFAPPPDLPPSVIYLTFPNFYCEPFHYTHPVTRAVAGPPHPAAGGTVAMASYAEIETAADPVIGPAAS